MDIASKGISNYVILKITGSGCSIIFMVTKVFTITLISFTENKNKLVNYIWLDKSEAGECQVGLELTNQICSPWPLCSKLVQNGSERGWAAWVLALSRAASWVLKRQRGTRALVDSVHFKTTLLPITHCLDCLYLEPSSLIYFSPIK